MAIDFTFNTQDTDLNGVDDVVIEVFDSIGTHLSTENTSSGQVIFSLDGSEIGKRYNFRAYKINAQELLSPVIRYVDRGSILVYEPPNVSEPNTAFLFIPPVLECSTDPACCKISLHVSKHDCSPFKGYALSLHTCRAPFALHKGGENDHLLGGDRIAIRTNRSGKAVFSLPRGGIYTTVLPDFIGEDVVIRVPDTSCADFMDLLFPYVKSIDADIASLTLLPGEIGEVNITEVCLSDLTTLDLCDEPYNPQDYLDVQSSNTSVATVEYKPGETRIVQVIGVSPGSADITFIPKQPSESSALSRFPLPMPEQTAVSITVS
jgi:hypothetical protein